jgi:dTDP-4-dehydrorhamnose reductase
MPEVICRHAASHCRLMILLLGASGYLGRAFAAELRKRKYEFTPLSRQALDYTRFDSLFHYVAKSKPALVINAAGVAGDLSGDCESSRADALQANTLLPQTLARVCYLSKTPWAHVSSGSIFSGGKISENGSARIERDLNQPEIRRLFESQPEKFGGYAESDEPNSSFRSPPCSFYSGTKALAEEALRWFPEGYIWRPCVMFDEYDHPKNYLSKIQSQANLPDTVNSFSHRGDFVRACLDLWERRAPFGIYNVVNPGAATAKRVADEALRILRLHKVARCEHQTQSGDGRILDASKLLSTGVRLRPLSEALEDSLKNWQPTPHNDAWPNSNCSASNKA